MTHIDPADVRRDVCLLSQNARLFHGTLRENLKLGAPLTNDDMVIDALKTAGAWAYVQRLPLGLDHPLQEGGLGLSGGQRQAILLARLILRKPRVMLLDEPTTAMDEATERDVIASLHRLSSASTLIVATHRMALVEGVDRIIVVDGGAIALDGAKDDVINRLRANDVPSPPRQTTKKSAPTRLFVRPRETDTSREPSSRTELK